MIYKNSIKILGLIGGMSKRTLNLGLMCTSLLTANVYAQNTTAYFVTYPEINENVEAFTNAFVKSLLPEIQQSEVQFDFSLENGVERTNMRYGQIAGKFTGLAVVPESNAEAAIDMNFRFYFEIVNPPNRPQKYGMNFKADGVIENSAAFTDFFLGILIPKCQEQSVSTLNQTLKNACQALSVSALNSNKSNVQKGFDLLTAWKQQLLESLNSLNSPNFNKIKLEFIEYIDQRIQISNINNQLNLSINMADLVEIFDDVNGPGREFLLKESKPELIDYSIQNLNVQMNSQKIDFSIHVQKLHAVKESPTAVNNMMNVALGYQEVIENPEFGALAGQVFRQTNDLIGSIQENASTLDNLSGNLTGIMGSLFGTANDNVPVTTDRQSDLGLD